MTDKDAKFYTNSGIEKTNHGDFEGAIRDFEKAEELLPDWALTHFSKAIAYHHLKQLEKAFESYTRAIELDGKWWMHTITGHMPFCCLTIWKKKA